MIMKHKDIPVQRGFYLQSMPIRDVLVLTITYYSEGHKYRPTHIKSHFTFVRQETQSSCPSGVHACTRASRTSGFVRARQSRETKLILKYHLSIWNRNQIIKCVTKMITISFF